MREEEDQQKKNVEWRGEGGEEIEDFLTMLAIMNIFSRLPSPSSVIKVSYAEKRGPYSDWSLN